MILLTGDSGVHNKSLHRTRLRRAGELCVMYLEESMLVSTGQR